MAAAARSSVTGLDHPEVERLACPPPSSACGNRWNVARWRTRVAPCSSSSSAACRRPRLISCSACCLGISRSSVPIHGHQRAADPLRAPAMVSSPALTRPSRSGDLDLTRTPPLSGLGRLSQFPANVKGPAQPRCRPWILPSRRANPRGVYPPCSPPNPDPARVQGRLGDQVVDDRPAGTPSRRGWGPVVLFGLALPGPSHAERCGCRASQERSSVLAALPLSSRRGS